MKIYSDYLSSHTTMQMGGEACIVELESEEDVEDFFNNLEKYNVNIDKVKILGAGSNILIGEDIKDLVFVKLTVIELGLTPSLEGRAGEGPVFDLWGGTSWDDFVAYTVEKGYKDLAYLSLIPGTVGAAPVQNIGAYGAEIKDTITEVRGYDFKERKWKTYKNVEGQRECNFAYRHSRFQKEKSFLITRVVFVFSPLSFGEGQGVRLIYPSLKNLIDETSSAKEVREAVIQVRDSKLPRVGASPSVGSFFHHPIVDIYIANKLKIDHSDMPLYEYDIEHKKLSAGWLIEHSGCADIKDETFYFYKNNHLVITHEGVVPLSEARRGDRGEGGPTLNKLIKYSDKIKYRVTEVFNIDLHIEPEIIK